MNAPELTPGIGHTNELVTNRSVQPFSQHALTRSQSMSLTSWILTSTCGAESLPGCHVRRTYQEKVDGLRSEGVDRYPCPRFTTTAAVI